jgi:hypothetical protein
VAKGNEKKFWDDLEERLEKLFTVKDRPKTRAAPVFTPEVLAYAHHLIAEGAYEYSAQTLLDELNVLDMLPEGSHDKDWFLHQLKVYAKSVGQPVTSGWSHCFVFQAAGDKELRVNWANDFLELWKRDPHLLEMTVFLDETTICRHPHPRGQTPRRLVQLS